LVREELDRRLVPRLRDRDDALLRRAHHLAAAAAARADEAREPAVTRGDLPLQQLAPCRALPDRALGRDLPDPDRALPGPVAHDRAALLRLLPAHLRPAAPALDGDRAADRLAARVGSLAIEDAALADRHGARRRRCADRRGSRLLAAGPDRLHL